MARRHREDWCGKRTGTQIVISPWAMLSSNEHATFNTVIAFLNNRLAESDSIKWALKLKPDQRIERIAISYLLNNLNGQVFEEPWASTWRLIKESWSHNLVENCLSMDVIEIQLQLEAGVRSGLIVSAIVDLVAPSLKVESIDPWLELFVKKPRRPKTFHDLILASLTSGDFVDPNTLELNKLTEVPFLMALANALEAAVNHGLDIARRIGWDGEPELDRLGSLHRADGNSKSDIHNNGIAPAVILLHAVVMRIAELELESAQPFVQRWRLVNSPVYTRMWATTALDPLLVSVEEVCVFLNELDDRQFWDMDNFPEIAKLRAKRFAELDQETQRAITTRLRKLPPRNYWHRKASADKVKNDRLHWAVRELGRIEIAGGNLPPKTQSWLEAEIGRFPELTEMNIHYRFPAEPEATCVPSNPDGQYDTLQGSTRLRALESALSTEQGNWYDNPATRARDWFGQSGKAFLVLDDLEAVEDGGDKFPSVWNRFGSAHAPEQHGSGVDSQRNLQDEAERVLRLLEKLSNKTLLTAIEGISRWLYTWNKQVIASPLVLQVWQRVWPIAVEVTNANQQLEVDANLSVSPRATDDDQEPIDLDTLNTPSGRLVNVFLSACPLLEEVPVPFPAGSSEWQMRDDVIRSTGRSGLIARYRLTEGLPYFLEADNDWAQERLISPLHQDEGETLVLWRAVAQGTHFTKVLKIIGDTMTQRATDRRLERETRQNLVFSLVVESLHAFREGREPAVANLHIQQMLRSLDDEVRATAANVIIKFVRDLSKKRGNDNAPLHKVESLFNSSAAPFLQDVWPREHSLTSPGISLVLAKLPATSGEAFAEAVEVIERFLVPIKCWSMFDYGFYDCDRKTSNFSIISDMIKAKALLRLLDLTIGTSENSFIPHDLTDALDQIRSVAPDLVNSPVFRRLSTAARR